MQLTPALARLASGGLFAWAAATLSVTGAPACQLQTANAGQTPCPAGQTCAVNLTLLHTADIHSRLLPYQLLITQVDGNLGLGTTGDSVTVGGAARLGYILKRERAKADRVLHISGGDVFEGAPIFNFFDGEPEMRVQAALQVDACALANHEFDRGSANVVRQIQKWADFPWLAANYLFTNPDTTPGANDLSGVIHPFTVLDAGGLKVAVIGMGNLSSLTSVFNTPNSFGIHPLNTVEAVQFYVDLLRPLADVIVIDSHLGLEADQAALVQTTGVDVWLGSHNHIVIDPPEQIADCSADPQNPGYIWVMDPNLVVNENEPPPNDALHPDPINHPYEIHRPCYPRTVILSHSGAFSKYVGRLDLVLSNVSGDIIASRTGAQGDAGAPESGTPDGGTGNVAPIYDPTDGFEVLSSTYQVFPISDATMGPEEADPVIVQLLEPYQLQLQALTDLTTIAGYSPNGAKRTAPADGDAPLGNLIAASNWLRLGVQTDFALTNTTGMRQDLLPGPVTIDEAYDIFPFDNTITTMYLSGTEIFQLYDFVARSSSGRGCVSQAQIAGSRVVLNCSGCTRTTDAQGNVNIDTCFQDTDCPPVETLGTCNTNAPMITDPQGNVLGYPCDYSACAQDVYIGFSSPALPAGQTCATAPSTPGCCQTDADCRTPTATR
jgi:5'-nucleotidase/UDP-sugar diphosphatase